jgi:hypothetical protein
VSINKRVVNTNKPAHINRLAPTERELFRELLVVQIFYRHSVKDISVTLPLLFVITAHSLLHFILLLLLFFFFLVAPVPNNVSVAVQIDVLGARGGGVGGLQRQGGRGVSGEWVDHSRLHSNHQTPDLLVDVAVLSDYAIDATLANSRSEFTALLIRQALRQSANNCIDQMQSGAL